MNKLFGVFCIFAMISMAASFTWPPTDSNGQSATKVFQCYQSLSSVVNALQKVQSASQTDNQLQELVAVVALNETLNSFYSQCEFALDMMPDLNPPPPGTPLLSCNEYETTVKNLVNSIVSNWTNYAATIDQIGELTSIIPAANAACNGGMPPGPPGGNRPPPPHRLLNEIITVTLEKQPADVASLSLFQCVRDLETLIPQIVTILRDIQSHATTETILKDLVATILDVVSTIADCGITLPGKDSEYLNDAALCLEDVEVIEPSLIQIIQEIEARNYSIVEVVHQLIAVYQQNGQSFLADCGVDGVFEKVTQKDPCLGAIASVVEDLVGAISGKVQNLHDLESIVESLVSGLEATVQECKRQ